MLAGIKQLLFPQKKKRLVAMFHFGRCGSTVVGTMLDEHPEIKWDSEVFERVRAKSLDEPDLTIGLLPLLKNRTVKFKKTIYGFETKAFPEEHLRPNLLNMGVGEYIDKLLELGFKDFIVLKRNNYLKFITSMYIGWQSNVWHVRNSDSFGTQKIQIDPNNVRIGDDFKPSLEQLLVELDSYYAAIEIELSKRNVPFLTLTYEEDVEKDPFIAYKKICSYLVLREGKPSIKIKKQNPQKLSELIGNYDEIHSYLSNTKYKWMLES